jgi:hypothetical protein
MKDVLISVVFVAGVVASVSFGGFYSFKYFAPKYAEVQNEVFKNSTAYNDGMLRDLENLMREYQSADAAHKEALKSIVIHRFSVYDTNKLPGNLAEFKRSLDRSF